MLVILVAILSLVLLAAPVFWPRVDFVVSGWFYRAGDGFFLADNVLFATLHWMANDGARVPSPFGKGFG